MRGVCLIGAVGLALLVACSSERAASTGKPDASASGFTESALREANVAYNTKLCEATARCDPEYFANTYGTTEACIARDMPFADLAEPYAFGTSATPDGARACTDALDFTSCELYVRYRYEVVVPEPCRPLHFGTLATDAACGRWSQCASGRCMAASDAPPGACGNCVEPEPVGARCNEQFGCVAGSTCAGADLATRTCAAFGEIGAPCNAAAPCHYWLVCNGGACSASDGSCDPDDPPGCPAIPNYRFCDRTTKRCVPWTLAGIGEACGPYGDSGYGIRCQAGATCTRIPGAGYECRAQIELGETCDPLAHPYEPPCKTGVCWDNRCQRRAAAACTGPMVPP